MKQLKIKQQRLNGSKPGELCIMATGGGAYKFYDKIRVALGVDVLREDEMECLIIGMPAISGPEDGTNHAAQVLTSLSVRFPARSSHIAKQIRCISQNRDQISTHTCWSILVPASA